MLSPALSCIFKKTRYNTTVYPALLPQTMPDNKEAPPHIITDSTSDVPPSMAKELGIDILHGRIIFGEKTYIDGVDMNQQEFLAELQKKDSPIPKTSQCTPLEYTEIFNTHPEPIISVNIAREFSGFITTGESAAKELGRFDIKFFDSGNASLGSGLLAIAAAKWARDGFKPMEIMAKLEDMKARTTVYALADTLKYLWESGRISRTELAFGTLFDIKPILRLKDGQAHSFAKTRTSSKGMITLIEKVTEHKPFEDIAVMHVDNEAGARRLADELQQYVDHYIIVAELTPTVASHIGPGATAVALVETPG
jgi:DegV family protein with EDD domain